MVPEKGASGDFVDEGNAYASESDLDYLLGAEQPQAGDGFNAFDQNTWDEDFTPVSTTPWHRSPQSRTLLIASAVALSAIVISVSLLVFRSPSRSGEPSPADTTTAVTTPLATATSERPPPPPPPPPEPPPPEPSTADEAPVVIRPTVRPRPTNKPEIGVTRTPQTRSPISVAPQQRGPRN